MQSSFNTLVRPAFSYATNIRLFAIFAAFQRQDSKFKFRLGLGLAVLSNVLFGMLYLYSSWLAPLSGTQVFLWRMVMMWFGLAGVMAVTHNFGEFKQFIVALNKRQWLVLLLPTPVLASQFWLFMWAPLNHQAINVAMGYFLFPLMMVLVGCIFFKERLNGLQWMAVGLAIFGVVMQIWQVGSISWATAWVCLTYPIYYGVRRWQGVPALFGLFVDLSIIAPVALGYLLWQQSSLTVVFGSVSLLVLLIGLGAVSTFAMQSNLKASALLPVNLFGMLSYLEPALLFVLSVLFMHETLTQEALYSFGLIWLAIAVMMGNIVLEQKKFKAVKKLS